MKQIKVTVLDKHTLRLEEDANKYDQIDLANLTSVDFEFIQKAINEKKDEVYAQRLKDFERTLNAEKNMEISKLKSINENIEKNAINMVNTAKAELTALYEKQIITLRAQLDSKSAEEKVNVQNVLLEEQKKYHELQRKLDEALALKEVAVHNKEMELEARYKEQIVVLKSEIDKQKLQSDLEKSKELKFLSDNLTNIISSKDQEINQLQRNKAALNVKLQGENLESWCNNEVVLAMQNGFANCEWYKDNEVIKEEDEKKGSKADYIFKIYSDEKNSNQLASICLEMKNESPDSKNKHKNADFYAQLDKNRNKKGCKYAVLVSELEMEDQNYIPIMKVSEYDNMYLVRPAYLMVFLNMIASLTFRFKEILLSREAHELKLKEKQAILDEFESIKDTYLDKPLEQMKSRIEDIGGQTDNIRKATQVIDNKCAEITRMYINGITDKISKFEINIIKLTKKLD